MTLSIDWDRNRWLFIPNDFPWHLYDSEDAWVEAVTSAFRRVGWKPEETAWLADYLRGLRANNRSGARRFAWLADPRRLLKSIDVFDLPHDASLTLDDLTGSDGSENDTREPIVTEITVPGLGTGHRVDRVFRVPHSTHEVIGDPREELLCMVFWVFRSEAADIVITVASGDPTVIASIMTDIEDFVARISLDPMCEGFLL